MELKIINKFVVIFFLLVAIITNQKTTASEESDLRSIALKKVVYLRITCLPKTREDKLSKPEKREAFANGFFINEKGHIATSLHTFDKIKKDKKVKSISGSEVTFYCEDKDIYIYVYKNSNEFNLDKSSGFRDNRFDHKINLKESNITSSPSGKKDIAFFSTNYYGENIEDFFCGEEEIDFNEDVFFVGFKSHQGRIIKDIIPGKIKNEDTSPFGPEKIYSTTDIKFASGMSGGALINNDGHLVGIVKGFSRPNKTVKNLSENLFLKYKLFPQNIRKIWGDCFLYELKVTITPYSIRNPEFFKNTYGKLNLNYKIHKEQLSRQHLKKIYNKIAKEAFNKIEENFPSIKSIEVDLAIKDKFLYEKKSKDISYSIAVKCKIHEQCSIKALHPRVESTNGYNGINLNRVFLENIDISSTAVKNCMQFNISSIKYDLLYKMIYICKNKKNNFHFVFDGDTDEYEKISYEKKIKLIYRDEKKIFIKRPVFENFNKEIIVGNKIKSDLSASLKTNKRVTILSNVTWEEIENLSKKIRDMRSGITKEDYITYDKQVNKYSIDYYIDIIFTKNSIYN